MGNVFTDAMGKIASNVTQSVVSALIVTAVTTYIIVSPARKTTRRTLQQRTPQKAVSTVAPMEKSGDCGRDCAIGSTVD